jgi:hypothetical protein
VAIRYRAARAGKSISSTTAAITTAARAAVADIGPVTRCRELPKAYSPTTGDTPAIEA